MTDNSLIPASSFTNYSQIILKIIYNHFLVIKIISVRALHILSLPPHLFLTIMMSVPELFSLTAGNPADERFPGFVTVSLFRFVFSLS